MIRNPLTLFGLFGRSIWKLIIGRMRYARGEDYDAERYWTDRFKKYGNSLRASGHEGLTEEQNRRMYIEAAKVFTSFCKEQGISFAGKRILEIGCGTGFYTDLISTLGDNIEFVGIDVTDIMFNELKNRHPSFQFVKADITKPLPDVGPFDVIVMIDVVQHIVTTEGFNGAMRNIKQLLAQGGVFIVAPISLEKKRRLFYIHWWTQGDFEELLPRFRFRTSRPFRGQKIGAIFS